MTHVLVHHKVEDYNKWKEVFDNFSDTRRASGEKSYQILQEPTSPNDLTLFFEWDTVENAKTFFTKSDELKSAMQRAGVAGEPKIEFLNLAAKGTL